MSFNETTIAIYLSPAALISVCQLFIWVVLWLALTAKRRWAFKLPPLQSSSQHNNCGMIIHPGKQKILNGMAAGVVGGSVTEPLLARSPPPPAQQEQQQVPIHHPALMPSHVHNVHPMDGGEEIYWPKMQQQQQHQHQGSSTLPNSPKMKVTFNEVTSMSTTSSTDPNHQNYALAGGEHGGKR